MKTYEELKQENFVIIDNRFFDITYQKKYGIESVLILSIIQKNKLMRGKYSFSINYLFNCLGIAKNDTRQIKTIKNCLVALHNDGIIISDVDLSTIKNGDFIYLDINNPNNDYTIVYDFELDSIVGYQKENIYILYYLFAFLKYRMNPKTKVMYWDQDSIADAVGLKSRKTVAKYIDILQDELDLIRYRNPGNRLFADGSCKQSNHVYAINYEDVDVVLNKALTLFEQEMKAKKIKLTNQKTADEKRKLARLINYRRNKYHEGTITEQELAELAHYEKEYYKLIKDMENKDQLEEKLDKFVLFNPAKQQEKEKANKQDKTVLVGRPRKSFAEQDKIMAGFTLAENSDDNNPLACFERVRQQNINPTPEDILGHDYASGEGKELKESLLAYMTNKRYIVNNMDEVKSKARRLKEIYIQEITG